MSQTNEQPHNKRLLSDKKEIFYLISQAKNVEKK